MTYTYTQTHKDRQNQSTKETTTTTAIPFRANRAHNRTSCLLKFWFIFDSFNSCTGNGDMVHGFQHVIRAYVCVRVDDGDGTVVLWKRKIGQHQLIQKV